jgi:ABC-type transporter Mla MlaB component
VEDDTMERQPLTWEIEKPDSGTKVVFSGDLDERCTLQEFPPLSGIVSFDLAGISRVTSGGVTRWIRFVRGLVDVSQLFFANCSVHVVTQLNMVRGFQGKGEIISFYAPYLCTETGEETEVLLKVEDVPDPTTPPVFPSEDGELVLNDIPKRYFAFLAHKAD